MTRLWGMVVCVVLVCGMAWGPAWADERDTDTRGFKEFLFGPDAPPPEAAEWMLSMPFRDFWEIYVAVAKRARDGAAEADRLRGVVERLRSENLDEQVAASMDKMRQEIVDLRYENGQLRWRLESGCE